MRSELRIVVGIIIKGVVVEASVTTRRVLKQFFRFLYLAFWELSLLAVELVIILNVMVLKYIFTIH